MGIKELNEIMFKDFPDCVGGGTIRSNAWN